MTETGRQQGRVWARGGTLLLSNSVKLAGLYIAVREILQADRDEAVLALAAFMMSGAQLSEEFFLRVIEAVIGSAGKPPEPREETS